LVRIYYLLPLGPGVYILLTTSKRIKE